MKRAPILICCDAGVAGRALLVRRDIEIRWALTAQEGLAALERHPRPAMCILREDFALDFLYAAGAMCVLPPSLVLLEPDGWARREIYLAAGATALVQVTSEDRILEAISDITGLQFRHCPRVPFSTVVDVTADGERYYLETVDVSATSVSIRGVPNPLAEIGARAKLDMMMLEPRITASGVVSRVFEENGEPVAAFSLADMAPVDRARLSSIVAQALADTPPLPDPVGMTFDLSGAFTRDIDEAVQADREAIAVYRNMIRERLAEAVRVIRLPSWLERIARALTDVEKRALTKGGEAPFAIAAIDARIQLVHTRIEDDVPLDVECARVFELCQTLAVGAAGLDKSVLSDVTQIRAALLRSLYADPKHDGLEVTGVEDARAPLPVARVQASS